MTETERNPYSTPAAVVGEAGQRFRWRIIPASLSWFVAAMLLFAGCVWVWQLSQYYLSDEFDQELFAITSILTSVLWVTCILNYLSAHKWMAGRWLFALVLNVSSGVLLFGSNTIMDYYVRNF